MNAFLVLLTVFMTSAGPIPFVQKLPFESIEKCEAWLADPAEIELETGPLTIVATDAVCVPRQDGKPA